MSWKISKTFSFCYGHRVYTQTTNEEFALNRPAKCRHNHGHEGLVKVYINGDIKDDGMVTDFCNLGWLKKFLDDVVDHKFVFGRNDPWYRELAEECVVPVKVPDTEFVVGNVIDLSRIKKDTPEYEIKEGYLCVDFIPTSENLSKWLFDICQAKMSRINVNVDRIDWWETPKSCSTYEA